MTYHSNFNLIADESVEAGTLLPSAASGFFSDKAYTISFLKKWNSYVESPEDLATDAFIRMHETAIGRKIDNRLDVFKAVDGCLASEYQRLSGLNSVKQFTSETPFSQIADPSKLKPWETTEEYMPKVSSVLIIEPKEIKEVGYTQVRDLAAKRYGDRYKVIIDRIVAGNSQRDIAKDLGTSRQSINRCLTTLRDSHYANKIKEMLI